VATRRPTRRWLLSILAAGVLATGGWCLVTRWGARPTTAIHTDRARPPAAPRWRPGSLPGAGASSVVSW
jgi:hypothetical protein